MNKYFGTDGIRGMIDEDMSVMLCQKVAYSYANYILCHDLPRVLFLGSDTRYSKDVLVSSLLTGLLDCGINVIYLGIVPTGMISYLVANHQVAGGIMVTASHNPPNMNGIKFFDNLGRKISREIEEEIEYGIDSNLLPIQPRKGHILSGTKYRKEYQDYTCSLSDNLSGYKILLDCANGSAGKIAPAIFKKLGAKVKALHTGKTGVDINVECGAVYPEQLFEKLIENKADIAFAYDGDADRLVVVLSDGRVLDGDDLLYVFALKEKASAVVGTVMSNQGLADALASKNITLYRAPVGDRNVLVCMQEHMCSLGAESSGHLCHIKYNLSCDGIMNSVYIANYLLTHKVVLPKKYPMIVENILLTSEQKVQAGMIDFTTLTCELEKKWQARILVRLSGTEPKLRIMLEEDSTEIKGHMQIVKELISSKLNLLF